MATTVTKVVDPDSGSGYDYASLSLWEAGQQGDLTGVRDEIAVAKCRCTGGTADTTDVTIDGWTTSATQYIQIWTDPSESYRHNGTYQTGNKYRLVNSAETLLVITESNVKLIGIQLSTPSTSGDVYAYYINTASTGLLIDSCIIIGNGNTGTGTNNGILLGGSSDGCALNVINTVVFNNKTKGVSDSYSDGSTVNLYNCVIAGPGTVGEGIRKESGSISITLKNCAVFGWNDDFYGSPTIDHCASDDGDGTNAVNISPGATEAADWAACFVDPTTTTYDFHLKSDSVCVGAALNLYNDATYPFQTDIDGQDRGGAAAAWDVGADEYVAAGGSSIVPLLLHQYRARRQ